MTVREYLTIGEVKSRLSADFPDLTVSKLRFLEDEGLVNPDRTPSGYRKYSDGDIERVQLILTMQRDQFLPLVVIRERLAEIDGEREREAEDVAPEPDAEPEHHTKLLQLGEAATEAQVSESFIKELAEFRMVDIEITRRGPAVSSDDLELVKIAAKMQRLGFGPRHLRIYATFASREADLYAPVLSPTFRHKTPESRAMLSQRLSDIGQELDKLRTMLFWRAVNEEFRELL
jgi:DNA-binding transcriptional MerR regulator